MKVFEFISEVSTPTGVIYLRFKEKMGEVSPNASKEEKAKAMYLTAYAGFANSPDELTTASARLRFTKLNTMEDIVKMIKSIFADKVFISAKTMTIYMDLPESAFKRYPYLGRFIDWAEENGKGRISIEWKPGGEGEAGPKKKRKPNPFKGQKIRDVDAADPRYTISFTVDDRFYREIERRLPNLMKYRGPGRTFLMPEELFRKFRTMAKEKYPAAEIKIVKKAHTAEEGIAPPSRPAWDRSGGNHSLNEHEIDLPLGERGKASRAFCTDPSRPRSKMGASQKASCISQGFLSHDSGKSVKVAGKRIKLRGTKLKGEKYGGPKSSKAG